MPWGDCVPWGAPGPWGWQWGDRGVSLGPGAGCGVAVGAVVAWPWLCLCCSGEGSPCIVLSSKVKKPAKKQPSELSRKPNQKEKRGRAEEKPRNKSASPHLPASPFLLGMGLFLHGSSPGTPGWGWGWWGCSTCRGAGLVPPPAELKGLEELLGVPRTEILWCFLSGGAFPVSIPGKLGTGWRGFGCSRQCHPPLSPVVSRGFTTTILPFPSLPTDLPKWNEAGRNPSPSPKGGWRRKRVREPLVPITEGWRRGRGGLQGWFPHPWDRQGSVRLCQGFSQHCCDPRITSLASPLCPGTPQPIPSRDIPGAVLDFGSVAGHKALPGSDSRPQSRSWALGRAVGSADTSACVCPSAPEPTVEEKLQKLHSEIKFALKVDNPVSGLAWDIPARPCLAVTPRNALPSPSGGAGRPQVSPGQPLTPVPSLQDIKRCLNALEELGTLQVTSHILQKHTDVVATLKKVEQRGLSPRWGQQGALPGPSPNKGVPPPAPRGRSGATKPTRT